MTLADDIALTEILEILAEVDDRAAVLKALRDHYCLNCGIEDHGCVIYCMKDE